MKVHLGCWRPCQRERRRTWRAPHRRALDDHDDWFACQAEATAFGLCIDPSADGAALGGGESCLYDPIITSFDVVMDGCTTATKVDSLCSSVHGCEWYTS